MVPIVLIVEDELLLRMSSAEVFADAGFCVREAHNGECALRSLEEDCSVHILFTDVHLPGSLDGLAVAHHTARCWPHIKIIVTSGRSQPDSDLLPPNSRFVPKPYDTETVVHHARELIAA